MRLLRLSLLVLAAFSVRSISAEDRPDVSQSQTPQPVAGPAGPVLWLDCQFGPVPGRDQVHLLLMTLEGRVARAVVEPYGIAGLDPSGLKIQGQGLTGKLVIGHQPRRMNRTLVPRIKTRMALQLDLVIEGGQITGTFSGSWPKAKTVDVPVFVEGKVTGRARREAELRQDGVSPQAVWPCWLGPQQNFSSGPSSSPLVADLNHARLVWASQWIGPTESGSQRYGACVGCPRCAGGASPVVVGSRLYQFRYEASGPPFQEGHLKKVLSGERGAKTRQQMEEVGWTMDDLRRRWAIHADEQLVCLDTATGKRLWKVTWPQEGINLYDHKCSLTNHTPAAADGNVFVFGSLGIVRCVDGQSGEVLWSAAVPGYSETMKKFQKQCLERRNVHAPTRAFCHGLNVIGGVVVAPDGIGACGLVGLDSKNGKVLWHITERLLGKAATPMAWNQDGTEYCLTANGQGVMACLEPRSGEILWKETSAGENEYQMLLVGDLLIGHLLDREARKSAPRTPDDGPHTASGENYGQVACWRLSQSGAKLHWKAPATWGAPSQCPIGSTAGGLICFRGNHSYHLVEAETGRRVASYPLPTPVRWDEGHLLALQDMFVLHPDSQHGQTKMFLLPAKAQTGVSPLWSPPHPHATTYQSAMSHAWADGRLFIRGADAIYCYDLRQHRDEG